MESCLSEQELAEIRDRCEKTTPGPWKWRQGADESDTLENGVALALTTPTGSIVEPVGFFDARPPWLELSERNSAFIAHARSDVPRLLEEVERLRNIIRQALAEGHCQPSEGSDPGWCLIDHVKLGRRDRIEVREEVERLRKLEAHYQGSDPRQHEKEIVALVERWVQPVPYDLIRGILDFGTNQYVAGCVGARDISVPAAIRVEREECAKVADKFARYEAGEPAPDAYSASCCEAIAAAIRSRS